MRLSSHLSNPMVQTTVLFLFLLSALASALRADSITVLAAASLSDALGEIAPAFKTATGHELRFSFGASGMLARQIREGAPADVFISADELRADQLEKAGLFLSDSRRMILANTLVVIVAAEGAPALTQLDALKTPAFRRIAIGDPATVPAGTYTRAYLEKCGLWQPLGQKLTPLDSVRAALAAVEAGNADAAFVYRTDALISRRVKIALEIPANDGPRITYPAAVLQHSRKPKIACVFVDWLASMPAQEIFIRHGFLPAP